MSKLSWQQVDHFLILLTIIRINSDEIIYYEYVN